VERRKGMIVAKRRMLRDRGADLIKELKRTTLTFEKLGRKYGVSRQAMHSFCKRRGIKRSVKRHQVEKCRLCQKLIRISKKPHSEFFSIHTLIKITGESKAKTLEHLRMLKSKGSVSQRFGRLRSKRAEKAYAIYLTEKLCVRKIGQKVGLKNLYAIIKQHREWGYDAPPSRYVYNSRERSRIWNKIKHGDPEKILKNSA
jgi:hypothetical protein